MKVDQETAARNGLMKMKVVYEDNHALGDPMTVEGKRFKAVFGRKATFLPFFRSIERIKSQVGEASS